MFQAKINGVRLLADGSVTVTLTCSGDNLQSIADSRKSEVIVYGAGEAPITDSRAAILSSIRSLAVQVAEGIDRELNQEITNEEWKACHDELPLLPSEVHQP